MKILFFIPALNPGGAERVIVTLANAWSDTCDVSILTLQNTPSFYQLNSKIKHIKMGLAVPKGRFKRFLFILPIEFQRLRFFVNYARKHHFDCILAFTETTSLLACLGRWLYGIQPIILSERNDPASRNFFKRILLYSLYKKSDGMICQNQYSKNYFLKIHYKKPLTVLPNPVDFQNIPTEDVSIKRREIVTVGRLTEQKNHRLLIDAFSELAEEYPKYTLKIYGVGPLQRTLEQQIKKLKLQNRVFLMGTKKRVMFDVQQSDIFVLSSDFEGFPNVLIEAMASGMPVISSDFPTGVARQLIKSGKNGYVFPVGNKRSLVQALKKMLIHPEKWAQMGRINLQIAQQYTAENIARDWLRTIKHLLEGSK